MVAPTPLPDHRARLNCAATGPIRPPLPVGRDMNRPRMPPDGPSEPPGGTTTSPAHGVEANCHGETKILHTVHPDPRTTRRKHPGKRNPRRPPTPSRPDHPAERNPRHQLTPPRPDHPAERNPRHQLTPPRPDHPGERNPRRQLTPPRPDHPAERNPRHQLTLHAATTRANGIPRCSSHASADPRSCVLPWSTGCGSRVETCSSPQGREAPLTRTTTTSTLPQRRPRNHSPNAPPQPHHQCAGATTLPMQATSPATKRNSVAIGTYISPVGTAYAVATAIRAGRATSRASRSCGSCR